MKALIVGCGGIAQVHAKAVSSLPGAVLAGCADIVPERAKAMGEAYGAHAYSSLEEMLDREQGDVLHICTPHYLHVPMALEGLKRGLHVFMEKPPAITVQQLEQLEQAVREADTQLGVCFQNRYNPNVQEVRRMLASGETGKVLGARAFVTWNRSAPYYTESGWRGSWETEGGGVLINQSIHTLDLLRYLLGEPSSVEGSVKNHHLKGVIQVEDTAEAYIRFGEIPALFYATTAYCADAPVMVELCCEKVTIRLEEEQVMLRYPDGQLQVHDYPVSPAYGKGYWGSGHQACIEDFYRCAEAGTPCAIPAADAGNTLRLMLGIYRSHHLQRPVELF